MSAIITPFPAGPHSGGDDMEQRARTLTVHILLQGVAVYAAAAGLDPRIPLLPDGPSSPPGQEST